MMSMIRLAAKLTVSLALAVPVLAVAQDPSANFTADCDGLSCQFMDKSTDPDGSIVERAWDFGDGDSSGSANPSHTYAAAGAYDVTLTVTDDYGGMDSVTQQVTVSAPSAHFVINAGITDAWFDRLTDGQGFFIIVWEDLQRVFLSWFTYDTERPPEDVMAILGEPGHRWVTAQGSYEGDTAMLNAFLTAGGIFDAAEPPAVTDPDPIGTMTIVWRDCNTGTLSYNLPDLGLSGDIPIERIVLDNVPACEAAQPQ